ncbi:MAG: methyltransferase domain-containing protein [Candidatus Thermoplasmatota archaeon]|nr:methyltransferase domain-containing protein [Candidatus Thermoplasmatota archaeon]
MMNRWGWLCPWLAILLAAGVLVLWGLSWWTALLAALFLVCPALILWGLHTLTRPEAALEPEPDTRGATMNWAAPFYDLYCPAVGLGRGFRIQTLNHAAIRPGERILDVGCGTGVLTRMALDAAGPGGSAVGIDPASKMIRVARETAARLGNRAEFKVAAIEGLPFPDAGFDVVLSSLMLHHLPPATKRQGLAEVYRVLKPGGRLAVADFARPANPLWWPLLWPALMMPSVADNLRGRVPALLREAGFTQVETRGHRAGLVTFWTALKPEREGGAS